MSNKEEQIGIDPLGTWRDDHEEGCTCWRAHMYMGLFGMAVIGTILYWIAKLILWGANQLFYAL